MGFKIFAKKQQIKHNNYMKRWSSLILIFIGLVIFSNFLINPITSAYNQPLGLSFATASTTADTEIDINNASSKEFQDYMNCRNAAVSRGVTSEKGIKDECGDSYGSSECNIEGAMGWFMCPVIFLIGQGVGSSYNFISSFFEINPKFFATDSSTHQIWSNIRNIANTGLVLFFLVMIISQISNFGISNYGIKKALPRLVMVTILINISFTISQFLIDISNITGASLVSFFDIVSRSASVTSSGFTVGGGLSMVGGVATAVLLGVMALKVTSLMMSLFSLILPMFISFILVIVTTGLMLLARQAAGIILVALSPIAFLSMIFPNTESLFKFWKQAMTAVLVTFPVISLLFGASALVSSILIHASTSFLMQTLGLVMSGLPMVFAPGLIKNTMGSLPVIGNKLSGFASGLQNSAVNKARNSKSVQIANKKHKDYLDRMNMGEIQGPGSIRGLRGLNQAVDSFLSRGAHRLNQNTQSGRIRLAEIENGREQELNQLSGGLTDSDAQYISSLRAGASIDQNMLSLNARQTIATMGLSGEDIRGRASAAAAMRMSSSGDLTNDNYNNLMTNASRYGVSDNLLHRVTNSIKQSSEENGNYAMAGHADGLLRSRGGATTANIQDFATNPNNISASMKNYYRRLDSEQLAKVNPDSITVGSLGQQAMKDLYDSDPNFRNSINNALASDNISAASNTGIRDAIR